LNEKLRMKKKKYKKLVNELKKKLELSQIEINLILNENSKL